MKLRDPFRQVAGKHADAITKRLKHRFQAAMLVGDNRRKRMFISLFQPRRYRREVLDILSRFAHAQFGCNLPRKGRRRALPVAMALVAFKDDIRSDDGGTTDERTKDCGAARVHATLARQLSSPIMPRAMPLPHALNPLARCTARSAFGKAPSCGGAPENQPDIDGADAASLANSSAGKALTVVVRANPD